MTAAKLYRRCMRWGLVTGAVAGSATAAAMGLYGPNLAFALAAVPYGLVTGLIVSLVPTAVASSLVTALLRRRHPHPASARAVERDLAALFCIIVFVLDVTCRRFHSWRRFSLRRGITPTAGSRQRHCCGSVVGGPYVDRPSLAGKLSAPADVSMDARSYRHGKQQPWTGTNARMDPRTSAFASGGPGQPET